MRIVSLAIAILASVGLSTEAYAHTGSIGDGLEWSFEPWVLIGLGSAAFYYALGLWRLTLEAAGRIIDRWQIAAFFSGLFVLLVALVSPIDTVGAQLFSVHMMQHLLLIIAAPPLLVWSRPAIIMLWAFPLQERRSIGHLWRRLGLTRGIGVLMRPGVVWTLFCGSFVFWHIPAPYRWALENEDIHVVEHLSFFLTSLAFWSIVIEPIGRRRLGHGATILFVVTTAVLSGLPGALMIFAPRPLYPEHAAGVAHWGLTLLEDQQLAGLVMWIPAGFVYVAATGWLFLAWLDEAERRVAKTMGPAIPVLTLMTVLLTGCQVELGVVQQSNAGGNIERGAALIRHYGCGGCHIVPGISGAQGLVGPPLTMMGRRVYVAGVLRNSPENMMSWLQDPQSIVPGNVMPNMGINPEDARDLTAYLFALR